MEFVQARHDIVRSVTHRWLIKCWGRLQSHNSVPLWGALELEDITSVIERLLFCDVVTGQDELQFRIRFQGKRITELYGADCRGKLLGSVMSDTLRDAALATYRETVRVRCPTYTVVNTADRDGNPVSYERLLLPFSFDGGKVTRILTALELISIEGSFARERLMVSPPAVEYAVCATIRTVPV
jgi:hypothetical protein